MKIFIADAVSEHLLDKLSQNGHEIVYKPQESAITLPKRVTDFQPTVIIANQTNVKKESI